MVNKGLKVIHPSRYQVVHISFNQAKTCNCFFSESRLKAKAHSICSHSGVLLDFLRQEEYKGTKTEYMKINDYTH